MTTPKTTQSAHPWRATVRTILAVVAGLATLVPAVLDAISDGDPANLGPWTAVALAVSGAVTRVLALPAVEAFLERFLPWLAAGGQGYAPVSADGVADITNLDVSAPAGYEVPEVSDAKTEVVDILHQLDGEDRLTIGDRQVERLIEMGWRPTGRTP
ncbi:hypothetical protein UQW22_09830 [Isoptericola halotolerans]|uniref:hypothetical protein n=1 Tax=Isoptericola halotolerans TaxID=300560 RepID=UPI003890A68C